jgi:hypothetical protein
VGTADRFLSQPGSPARKRAVEAKVETKIEKPEIPELLELHMPEPAPSNTRTFAAGRLGHLQNIENADNSSNTLTEKRQIPEPTESPRLGHLERRKARLEHLTATTNFGVWRYTMIDTESREYAESSDSLKGRPLKRSSGLSRRRSRTSSEHDQEKDAQPKAEEQQSTIEFLLSLLMSDLIELEDAGQKVIVETQNGILVIGLPNVGKCPNPECTILHHGTKCPICR